MVKLTQKQRRDNKKHLIQQPNNEQSTEDEYDEHNEKTYKVMNISNKDITPKTLKNVETWINTTKRTITFNGIAPFDVMNKTDDILYFKGFTGCFLSIVSTAETCQDLKMPYLFQWVKEKHTLMVLKLNDKNDVVCFAVLHKTDFDPLKIHKKPYIMDYIYTYEKYRCMGYATSLINDIKAQYQFTAFCENDLSEYVFKRCNLNLIMTKNPQLPIDLMMARTQ